MKIILESIRGLYGSRSEQSTEELTSSLPPQDEVAGSPTGFGARWWRDVGVLDLFPVLRIERLAIAEHGLSWKVVELHKLVDERILIGREVGDAVAWFVPFVGRHALREVVERRSRQPKALG